MLGLETHFSPNWQIPPQPELADMWAGFQALCVTFGMNIQPLGTDVQLLSHAVFVLLLLK